MVIYGVMITLLFKLLLILFICVTVTDRLNFWGNLGSELHRILLGTKKEVKLPYIFTCSLCQCTWVSLIYVAIFYKITLVNIALVIFVSALNQIMFQLLNLIENLIIIIFKKMTEL